tara:strand:+ start:83 stop:439 length:357 start_codon:yes stop_codon:yes gene_type:complete
MVIVEYILDPQDQPRSYRHKTTPSFISDGGYFVNPDGSEKMIGTVESEDDVPDGIATFTIEELQARQRSIHAIYPFRKLDYKGNDYDYKTGELNDYMTDDEVNDTVIEWKNWMETKKS